MSRRGASAVRASMLPIVVRTRQVSAALVEISRLVVVLKEAESSADEARAWLQSAT